MSISKNYLDEIKKFILINYKHFDSKYLKFSGNIGDKHDEVKKFKFSYIDKSYIYKYSPVSSTEYLAYNEIKKIIRKDSNIIPKHYLINDKTLIREFIDGYTISEINNYLHFTNELHFLLKNSKGLRNAVMPHLSECINKKNNISLYLFKHSVFNLFNKFPQFYQWQNKLSEFFEIPLNGEGCRPIIGYATYLYNSQLKEVLPFKEFQENELLNLSSKAFLNLKDNSKQTFLNELKNISSQLGTIAGICEVFQLYDIHMDNILLNPKTNKLFLFDLECFNGGTSEDLIDKYINGLVKEYEKKYYENITTLLGSNFDESKNYQINHFKTNLEYLNKEGHYKRIIYAGTNTFEFLIRILKESLFYSVVIPEYKTFNLNLQYDDDIKEFELHWYHFQVWKRYFRGLSNCPISNSLHEINLRELIITIENNSTSNRSNNPLLKNYFKLLNDLRNLNFSSTKVTLIIERILPVLKKIPFSLYNKNKDIEIIKVLENKSINGDKRQIQHIRESVKSLLNFSIPFSFIQLNESFEVDYTEFIKAKEKLEQIENLKDPDDFKNIENLLNYLWSE